MATAGSVEDCSDGLLVGEVLLSMEVSFLFEFSELFARQGTVISTSKIYGICKQVWNIFLRIIKLQNIMNLNVTESLSERVEEEYERKNKNKF